MATYTASTAIYDLDEDGEVHSSRTITRKLDHTDNVHDVNVHDLHGEGGVTDRGAGSITTRWHDERGRLTRVAVTVLNPARPRTLEEQEALEASLLEEARRTGQDHYKYLCKVDRTREEFAAGADLPDLIRFMRPIAGTELVKRTYYSIADKRLLDAVEAMLRTKTHEDPSDPSK